MTANSADNLLATTASLGVEQRLQGIEDMLLACQDSALGADEPYARIATAQILIIDDEPVNLKVARKYLKEAGYCNVTATSDSRAALEIIRSQQPALILLDLMMPDVDGLELLRRLRADAALRQIPVIVLTATDDQSMKLAALELGASDFLPKPVDPTDLLPRIRNVLTVKAYQDHLQHYAHELERQVQQRTAELEASRLEVIYCLGRAAEYRDNETGKHVVRVGRYVGVIARGLGMDEQTAVLLETAAPLHDMGKIGIPDAVLLKPGRLDEREIEIMRKHAEYGCDIVSTMNRAGWKDHASHTSLGAQLLDQTCSPLLRMASVIALTHHERWDGTGYPRQLRGEEIPIEGRITAVADVFDALSSNRPYKPAMPFDECFRVLEESRGTHFDPRVLDVFLAHKELILRIRSENPD